MRLIAAQATAGIMQSDDVAAAARGHTRPIDSSARTAHDALICGLAAAGGATSYGIVIADAAGTILWANRAATRLRLDRHGVAISNGQIVAPGPDANAQLQREITSSARTNREPDTVGVRLALIRRPAGGQSLPVVLVPWSCGDGGETGVSLLIPSAECGITVASGLLREQYNLTPVQANVAALLACGHGAREISQRLGIALPTVRSHLARLFAATGERRQGALVARFLRGPVAWLGEL
jgi:DNA-binding CsgD family transcriptional regulator